MDIKGKVIVVLPMQSGTSVNGEWKRQTIVVEYQDGTYTSKVALDNIKKADDFAKLKVGDVCTFKCNTPTSREFNGRWYTSVNCWGWDIESKSNEVPSPQPQATVSATPVKQEDDMPF